jgi:hypothetical protein
LHQKYPCRKRIVDLLNHPLRGEGNDDRT